MDELEINQEEQPQIILKEKENEPNLYDKYIEGTEKLWGNYNSNLVGDYVFNQKIIGPKFMKEGKVSYFEIFNDPRTSILGMSSKISLLYIPSGLKNEKFDEINCIGFRYYEENQFKICHYFTLIKKNNNKRYYILEKEHKMTNIKDKSFYDENLNCFSIMRKIIFEKYEKEEETFLNGELFPEIIGFAYSMVYLGQFKNFIAVEPLILDQMNRDTIIERLPKELEKNIGYIEPILYNNHVSILLVKKSINNLEKRVNIVLDMSRFHTKENILDNTIFPKDIYINNYPYPKFSIQKNNTCGLWYYGIIDCIYNNDKYKNIQDICLSINNNSTRFFIDVINALSNKLYKIPNIIDDADIIKATEINTNRIYDSSDGKKYSFTKEAFLNYYFSLASIFDFDLHSNYSIDLKILFEYQFLIDQINEYLRLVRLNNSYFKNYSSKYEEVQKLIYKNLID